MLAVVLCAALVMAHAAPSKWPLLPVAYSFGTRGVVVGAKLNESMHTQKMFHHQSLDGNDCTLACHVAHIWF